MIVNKICWDSLPTHTSDQTRHWSWVFMDIIFEKVGGGRSNQVLLYHFEQNFKYISDNLNFVIWVKCQMKSGKIAVPLQICGKHFVSDWHFCDKLCVAKPEQENLWLKSMLRDTYFCETKYFWYA